MPEYCAVPLDVSLLRTDLVLNESESMPIRDAVASQRKALAEMDSKVAHIEQRIQELRRQREVVQNALAVNEAFLAPMRRVAPETLGKIFEYCLPQEQQKTRSRDSPLLFMRVSRRWRSVAQETPRLWMHVVVDSKTPMPYAEMWIKNSGSLPLSVALHLGNVGTAPAADSDTDEEIEGGFEWMWDPPQNQAATIPLTQGIEITQMFIEQMARIRRFDLNCSYSILEIIFPRGLRRNMASLEELAVSCSYSPRLRSNPGHDVYQVDETRLHTLTLHQDLFSIISIKPTSNLRVLKLLDRHPISRLFEFLRLCPGLEELIIQHMLDAQRDDTEDPERDLIILPNLWKLEIEWGSPGRFLRSIHAPIVRTAVLRNFSGEMKELYHFFTDCASNLRHLTMEGLLCTSYQFYLIMKDLTELETLSLGNFRSINGFWEPFTPEEDCPPNLWICPKLHSLECSDIRVENRFVDFVRRRMAPIPQGGLLGSISHASGFNYIKNVTLRDYEGRRNTLSMLEDLPSQSHGLVIHWEVSD